MKIKRFLAPNMREALKAVRTEQGPDAVILSNQRVGDYIEIIAALDYDEALVNQALRRTPALTSTAPARDESRDDDPEERDEARAEEAPVTDPIRDLLARADQGTTPANTHRVDDTHITALEVSSSTDGDFGHLHGELSALREMLGTQLSAMGWQHSATANPARATVLRNLTRLGVDTDISERVCAEIEATDHGYQHAWRQPIAELSRMLPTSPATLMADGGVAAFVGPTGAGKTTTIAKIASQFAVRHGARDIALVSMDNHRIGAQDQLRMFGRILNAAVFEASGPETLMHVLERLTDYRLVLIDTAGIGQRDQRLATMLDGLGQLSRPVSLYLTLPATTDAALLDDVVRCYSAVQLAGAAVTKVDEAARLGGVLSTLIRHRLPATFICDGQRVPDDLASAEKRKLWLMNKALEYASDHRFVPQDAELAARFGRKENTHG